MKLSPCLSCGACCAAFHVSFPESETDNMPGGYVPEALTVLNPRSRRAMKGTQGLSPRCIALEGRIGFRVRCSIYEKRPSACRKFNLAWENRRGNDKCDRARAFFGLQPFSPY